MLAVTETPLAAPAPVGDGNLVLDLLTGLRPESVPLWAVMATSALIAVGLAVALISLIAMFSTWMERKVAGHIQCRYGPMHVGWHGWLQPIADGVKLLLKEDIIPKGADKVLFVLSPAIVLASLLGAMAALALSPNFFFADIDLGVFFILAMTSTTTIGVVMAGWASNSKWSLYGSMREAAQVIAYEVPLGISLMVPLIVAGTFNLREASAAQGGWYGMHWFVFQNPFMLPAFLLFFTAVLAETKRAPFDLPESESELVSGFLTEYSGIRWSFFFMEEYAAMFLYSAVGAFFFFGGFESPFTWAVAQMAPHTIDLGETIGTLKLLGEGSLLHNLVAVATIVVKAFAGVFLMMWVRWSLPRIRIDQVMTLGYKYLTPLSMVCVLGAALFELAWIRFFGGAS
ncbi:MAG: NADH-quinone oxidoreductase subunit NuoH [Planctomycetes bacterium]|nr:NADH-quinone oxidoreductase subunit NuoH [Planctomycetota bacterium]